MMTSTYVYTMLGKQRPLGPVRGPLTVTAGEVLYLPEENRVQVVALGPDGYAEIVIGDK